MIFGSVAIKHWFPDFREPKDLDVMSPESKMEKGEQNYWIPEFEELIKNNKDDKYLDPDFLLAVKQSHLGWNIHWEKTRDDVLFLKSKGCKCDPKLYFKLVKAWTKVHGIRWATLKGKDSKTFFEDAVKRKYIHDDIHKAVAVYDEPLYEKLLTEGVSCGGFDSLSFEDKLLLVKEEVWVTALERFHIPSNFTCGHLSAYSKSFKKLATTMSSGKFKFFILDSIDKLYICKDRSYIDKFKQAEKENKLKLEKI